MKIEYEQIIKRAEARRQTLQDLVLLLNELPEQVLKLERVKLLLSDIDTTYSTLDREGKDMLPDDVQDVLSRLPNIRNLIDQGYSYKIATGNDSAADGLFELAKFIANQPEFRNVPQADANGDSPGYPKYLVICRDDKVEPDDLPSYVPATHQFFIREGDALSYAASIPMARESIVVTFHKSLMPTDR